MGGAEAQQEDDGDQSDRQLLLDPSASPDTFNGGGNDDSNTTSSSSGCCGGCYGDGDDSMDEKGESWSASELVIHVVLTAAFLTLTLVVALFLTDLGTVLAVVGATGSTIVSYILPGAIYWSIHTSEATTKRWLAGLLFCVGCVIIPVALTFIALGEPEE